MNKTIFIDLDGTVFEHVGSLTNILSGKCTMPPNGWLTGFGRMLPGVIEKFNEWAYKGYHIVITTARPESMREFTKKQIEHHCLFYDQLIMGIPRGPRVLINDIKPATNEYEELLTAEAVNVVRNVGLVGVDV